MSSSRDRFFRTKSGEHDKGIMSGRDDPHEKIDTNGNLASSITKDKKAERDSRPSHGFRDDSNKREEGLLYSRFAQGNASHH
jgi:hypothetical protein